MTWFLKAMQAKQVILKKKKKALINSMSRIKVCVCIRKLTHNFVICVPLVCNFKQFSLVFCLHWCLQKKLLPFLIKAIILLTFSLTVKIPMTVCHNIMIQTKVQLFNKKVYKYPFWKMVNEHFYTPQGARNSQQLLRVVKTQQNRSLQ